MAKKLTDEEQDALDIKHGWQNIMATREGRRVVWEFLGVAGLFRGGESLEPQVLAYTEGKRTMGAQTLYYLSEHCPDAYDLMTKENRDRLLLAERKRLEKQKEEGTDV